MFFAKCPTYSLFENLFFLFHGSSRKCCCSQLIGGCKKARYSVESLLKCRSAVCTSGGHFVPVDRAGACMEKKAAGHLVCRHLKRCYATLVHRVLPAAKFGSAI